MTKSKKSYLSPLMERALVRVFERKGLPLRAPVILDGETVIEDADNRRYIINFDSASVSALEDAGGEP